MQSIQTFQQTLSNGYIHQHNCNNCRIMFYLVAYLNTRVEGCVIINAT